VTLRRLAFATLLLWAVTLAMPASMSVAPDWRGVDRPERIPGVILLVFGPLAPLASDAAGRDLPGYEHWPRWAIGGHPLAAWGWYAHPFWAWGIARMLRGRGPRLLPALLCAALALLALQPYHSAMDEHGRESETVPLAGAFVWAAAMSGPLLALLGMRAGGWIARPHALSPIKRRRAGRSCRRA
jgi:hypothetical protein